MNPVKYVLGGLPQLAFEDNLVRLAQLPAWQPFDKRAMAFVRRFSQRLLTSPGIRQHPEMAALGHWFRGANLVAYADRYKPDDDNEVVTLGRGLVFHLAPSNVDSVFMYSWLISLLAGNVNIVRISQKSSAALDFLVSVLRDVLQEAAGQAVCDRIVLLTYPHDDRITQSISERCMARVVWGGDTTVKVIRAIPLRTTAVEVCFADRFSAAVINAEAVLAANDAEIAKLAASFYNDAFWFAQQACSSPRMIAWVGPPNSTLMAAEKFWNAVSSELIKRQPENSEAMSMARVAASFEYAAAKLARPQTGRIEGCGQPLRLQLEYALQSQSKELHCGNGLFLETHRAHLKDLAAEFSDKEQTLSVFGFTNAELRTLVLALPPRSVDRIVPIGEALAFAPIWDGQDLVTFFSRKISLPKSY